ncbi:MAG: HAD family hydrolase [Trueperaceae bacterium]
MTPAVSFDLDGVVMDNPFESCVLPRIRRLIHQRSRLADLAAREADALLDAAITAEWTARLASDKLVMAFDWDGIYAKVSRDFGGPEIPSVAGIVEECCRPECIRLLPGVHEGIELLHRAGYRTVALTNGYSHYQAPVLKALGVSELFDELVAPNVVDSAKPDSGIFLAVRGLVVHVGDTLYADVLGARRAGLKAIWLTGNVPETLRSSLPVLRPRHVDFADFLMAQMSCDPQRERYGDFTASQLECDALAQDVKEAAEAVIELFG